MPAIVHPVAPEELMAYLDGEGPGTEAAMIREHLTSCAECQALATEFKSVSESLQEWAEADVDAAGGGRRWQAASSREASSQWGSRLRWTIQHRWLVSSGIAAVVLVGVFFSPRSRPVKKEQRAFAAVEQYAMLQRKADAGVVGGVVGGTRAAVPVPPPPANRRTAPKVVRTASLTIATAEYGRAREKLDRALAAAGGFTAQLGESSSGGEERTLTASLRVPATALDATLARLRELGRVESESQSGEEVTARVVNVEARLSNLRAAEARLTGILRERTGRLSDVLAVEEHLTSVRGEIETAEAEQKLLATQVAMSRIDLRVTEEIQRSLGAGKERGGQTPVGLRLWNAFAEGLQNLRETVVTIAAWLLQAGPVLLAIAAILFFPVRAAVKRERRKTSG